MPRGEFDRTERRARTRAQLLDAAARLYAERGVDGATLDDVAEEAGFTKGAVYDHFGSKENLLTALLDEHLAAQIGEQISLFEAGRETPERPRIGADRWIAHVEEEPNTFRLFVEAWVKGQRDEAMRERIVAGLDAWREMFRGFGEQRTAELGEERSAELLDNVSNLMVALGTGFAMLKLADPDSVPASLLGAAYVVMLGALEASPEARALVESARIGEPTAELSDR
jgi:AcrR family transcriptional regulator